MNKLRRKQLKRIINQLEELKDSIEEIQELEESVRDNIPENLRSSCNCEKVEEAIFSLEDAVSDLEECIGSIESAIE